MACAEKLEDPLKRLEEESKAKEAAERETARKAKVNLLFLTTIVALTIFPKKNVRSGGGRNESSCLRSRECEKKASRGSSCGGCSKEARGAHDDAN